MAFELEKAKELREDGKTLKEISTILVCSEGYVRQKLAGIPRGKMEYEENIPDALTQISRQLKDIADLMRQ